MQSSHDGRPDGRWDMADRILEGTWEEIAAQGHYLAGRRVRVTVIDGDEGAATLDRALAPLLEAAESLSRQLPPAPAPPTADAWGDAVVEKFRRQGFAL
jgi:hypothetical protein